MEGHGQKWFAETTSTQLLDVSRNVTKVKRGFRGGSTMTETVNNLMEANLLEVFNERDVQRRAVAIGSTTLRMFAGRTTRGSSSVVKR